jgi:hypothetical protein
MAYGGVEWYSRWGVTTAGGGGLWSWNRDVDPVSTNLAQLAFRMVGGQLAAVSNASVPGSGPWDGSIVNAVVAAGGGAGAVARVLLFRHHPDVNDTGSTPVNVTLSGLPGAAGQSAVVTTWQIDDQHAQFWNQWQADVAAAGIDSFFPGWSATGEEVMLTNATQAAYFASRVPAYQQLATLAVTSTVPLVLGPGGTLNATLVLTGHHVVLWEVALQ